MSDTIQRSPEWFNARIGKVTASNVYKIFTKGEGKTRASYMRALLDERLTGLPSSDVYENDDMRDGAENEGIGRSWYEAETGVMVDEVGFIEHPTIKNFGASPDGIIPSLNKGLEIKRPKRLTHLTRYMAWYLDKKDPIEVKYRYQMLAGMACLGYNSWDYLDYHEDYVDRQILITIERNEKEIEAMEQGIKLFLDELDELEAKFRR